MQPVSNHYKDFSSAAIILERAKGRSGCLILGTVRALYSIMEAALLLNNIYVGSHNSNFPRQQWIPERTPGPSSLARPSHRSIRFDRPPRSRDVSFNMPMN